MRQMYTAWIVAILIVVAGPVQAQVQAQETLGWRGEAQLGAMLTIGNTETEQFNGKLSATHEPEPEYPKPDL